MPSNIIISTIASISGVFGLLAIIAYFYFIQQRRVAILSIKNIVEGEGIFNADQVVQILEQFDDDNARLEALKALTMLDSTKAKAILKKVNNNVDVNRITQISSNHYIQITKLTSFIFFALALFGLIHSISSVTGGVKIDAPKNVTKIYLPKMETTKFELFQPSPAFIPVDFTIIGEFAVNENTVKGRVIGGHVRVSKDIPKMFPEAITKIMVSVCHIVHVDGVDQSYMFPDKPRTTNSLETEIKLESDSKSNIPQFEFSIALPENEDFSRAWLCGALWNGPGAGFFPAH